MTPWTLTVLLYIIHIGIYDKCDNVMKKHEDIARGTWPCDHFMQKMWKCRVFSQIVWLLVLDRIIRENVSLHQKNGKNMLKKRKTTWKSVTIVTNWMPVPFGRLRNELNSTEKTSKNNKKSEIFTFFLEKSWEKVVKKWKKVEIFPKKSGKSDSKTGYIFHHATCNWLSVIGLMHWLFSLLTIWSSSSAVRLITWN